MSVKSILNTPMYLPDRPRYWWFLLTRPYTVMPSAFSSPIGKLLTFLPWPAWQVAVTAVVWQQTPAFPLYIHAPLTMVEIVFMNYMVVLAAVDTHFKTLDWLKAEIREEEENGTRPAQVME